MFEALVVGGTQENLCIELTPRKAIEKHLLFDKHRKINASSFMQSLYCRICQQFHIQETTHPLSCNSCNYTFVNKIRQTQCPHQTLYSLPCRNDFTHTFFVLFCPTSMKSGLLILLLSYLSGYATLRMDLNWKQCSIYVSLPHCHEGCNRTVEEVWKSSAHLLYR